MTMKTGTRFSSFAQSSSGDQKNAWQSVSSAPSVRPFHLPFANRTECERPTESVHLSVRYLCNAGHERKQRIIRRKGDAIEKATDMARQEGRIVCDGCIRVRWKMDLFFMRLQHTHTPSLLHSSTYRIQHAIQSFRLFFLLLLFFFPWVSYQFRAASASSHSAGNCQFSLRQTANLDIVVGWSAGKKEENWGAFPFLPPPHFSILWDSARNCLPALCISIYIYVLPYSLSLSTTPILLPPF